MPSHDDNSDSQVIDIEDDDSDLSLLAAQAAAARYEKAQRAADEARASKPAASKASAERTSISLEPEAPAEEAAASEPAGTRQDLDLVGRVAELERALEDQAKLASEYLDHLRRMKAEFENFRRRSQRDLERTSSAAKTDIIVKLLPTADNLERALAAARKQDEEVVGAARALLDGVAFVHKDFLESLRREGVERIDVIGKTFDPRTQEAISIVPVTDQPDGAVIAEVQAGYLLDGEPLRAARVVVAKNAAAPATAPGGAAEDG
ncbi:MAG: nucleotide exchange factor GrpE [Candidatus Schekmanbacteria bacterium]|nr:nucleotide exchange factor GrpE [Candidatus Schekmanbacteria bacterium]